MASPAKQRISHHRKRLVQQLNARPLVQQLTIAGPASNECLVPALDECPAQQVMNIFCVQSLRKNRQLFAQIPPPNHQFLAPLNLHPWHSARRNLHSHTLSPWRQLATLSFRRAPARRNLHLAFLALACPSLLSTPLLPPALAPRRFAFSNLQPLTSNL